MSFYQMIQHSTQQERNDLMRSPIILSCHEKNITLIEYIYFLTQAYHHVKHTVPLLKTCKANLPDHYQSLSAAFDTYINEEAGHEQWILNDIVACGGDRHAVENGTPCKAITDMLDFLYGEINNGHPLTLFGMVQVLEGTSVAIACKMADLIQTTLQLPNNAFTYLRSHGELDQAHIKFFERLVNQISIETDQRHIIDSAKYVYKCYTAMLLSVRPHQDIAA